MTVSVSSFESKVFGPKQSELHSVRRTGGVQLSDPIKRQLTPQDRRKAKLHQRILAAAAELFSRRGFNGVGTREIAALADVNELTVYRHFARKHDLYLAVLAQELGRVHIRGDQLKEIAEAADIRQALMRTFSLIETTMQDQPSVLPLILYAALEAEVDVAALLQRHLGEFVEILVKYLDPWTQGGGIAGNARSLVMAVVSLTVFRRSFERIFPAAFAGADTVEVLADLCSAPAGA